MKSCPLCSADLAYEVDGKEYSRGIGVEISGVYDGVLFYLCPVCDGTWHRWPVGDWLYGKATSVMAAWAANRPKETTP